MKWGLCRPRPRTLPSGCKGSGVCRGPATQHLPARGPQHRLPLARPVSSLPQAPSRPTAAAGSRVPGTRRSAGDRQGVTPGTRHLLAPRSPSHVPAEQAACAPCAVTGMAAASHPALTGLRPESPRGSPRCSGKAPWPSPASPLGSGPSSLGKEEGGLGQRASLPRTRTARTPGDARPITDTHIAGPSLATATPIPVTSLPPLYKLPVPSSVPRNHLPNIRILKNMARF